MEVASFCVTAGAQRCARRRTHPLRLVSSAGVLRGLHFAQLPLRRAKYATCPHGRCSTWSSTSWMSSPTFGRWDSVLHDDRDRGSVCISECLAYATCPARAGSAQRPKIVSVRQTRFGIFCVGPGYVHADGSGGAVGVNRVDRFAGVAASARRRTCHLVRRYCDDGPGLAFTGACAGFAEQGNRPHEEKQGSGWWNDGCDAIAATRRRPRQFVSWARRPAMSATAQCSM